MTLREFEVSPLVVGNGGLWREDLVTAVKAAKQFITAAIQNSPGLGQGYGPVNMHASTDF